MACEERPAEQQEVAAPASAGGSAPAGVELRAARLWSSSPDIPLSWVVSIAVDSRGRVYLWDRDEGILLLGSDGAVSRTIAPKGEGPGEYRRPGVLQILPGDSLLAYDPGLRRVTVFTPEAYSVAYTHRLEGSIWGPGPSWAARVHDPVGYLTMFEPLVFSEGRIRKEEDRKAVLRLLALDGSLRRDSLLLLPAAESIVIRRSSREGPVMMTIPFGRQSVFALMDDDRIVHGWTDSLAVEIRDLGGRRIGGFSAPRDALPLTREEVEQWADRYNEGRRGGEDWGHEPGDALRESAPETWPAFERLLVDDRGRIWILLTTREGMPSRWVIFEQSGEEVAWIEVPSGLQAVRNDLAYGLVFGDYGVPIVSAYKIEGLAADEEASE